MPNILNKKVSIFKNASDTKCKYEVEIGSVFKAITEGKWKEEIEAIRSSGKNESKELKKNLPAVTFCGTFSDRVDTGLKEYTGILLMDIDNRSVSEIKWARNRLMEDPYVAGFFMSPTGGIKVIYVTDCSPSVHRDVSYKQASEYFRKRYAMTPDPTSKNLSRLCFISYDPDAISFSDFKYFPVDLNKKYDEATSLRSRIDRERYSESTDMGYIFKVCKKWTEGSGHHYAKGSRNNYVFVLTCNLNRAGVHQQDIINMIFMNHSIQKEMAGEILRTIRSAVESNKTEFNTRPVWQLKNDKPNIMDLLRTGE